jgi:hypothetical protein
VSLIRRVLPLLVVGAFLCWGAAAGATGIAAPGANPFAVGADGSGRPVPFTIVATGFAPGSHVYVEQCDGVSPSAPLWSPTIDCDLGTSPAGAAASADGRATFAANDRNYGFHPFRGMSPESLFNCLAVGQVSPHNGLLDSRHCTVRVSTSNSAPTADQVFFVIDLPAPPPGSSSATSPPSSGPTAPLAGGGASGSGPGGSGTAGASGPVVAPAGVTGAAGATGGAGRLALTGRRTLGLAAVGLECIAVGLAFSSRRRARRRGATRV